MERLITILLFLLLVSCGAKRSRNLVEVSSIIVRGDPIRTVGKSKNDPKSFFSIENYNQFSNFRLIKTVSFESKVRGKRVRKDRIEALIREMNSAPTDVPDEVENRFSFEEHGDLYSYSSQNSELKFVFEVDKSNGSLNISSIDASNYRVKVRPLHYSVNIEKKLFSILVSMNDGFTDLVRSFVFSGSSDSYLRAKLDGNSRFNFLLGRNKRAILREKTEISYCGDLEYSYLFDYSFAEWNRAFRAGYLSKKILKEYAPFSDVNTHCVYVIDGYLTNPNDQEHINTGTAVSVIDDKSREIVDSDVFIWKGELDKMRGTDGSELHDYRMVRAIYSGMIHEMGHMLGLHHQFDSPSVMGYEGLLKLTDYDLLAIKALYFE